VTLGQNCHVQVVTVEESAPSRSKVGNVIPDQSSSSPAPIGDEPTAPNDGTAEQGPAITLRDGVVVDVRRLSVADFDSVVALADSLSDGERYLRFFTVHPRGVVDWATSQTKPAEGMVALGAYDHGELVGVANYATSKEPGQAEIAVLVAHDQHDRGVGTALLAELIRLAKLHGQRHLVADVLAENYAMRRVIIDSQIPVTWHRDGSVFNVEIDLDALGGS
jgi:RimJ/RimL family protein N-acetyltransferase